jgi:hypothetical protein
MINAQQLFAKEIFAKEKMELPVLYTTLCGQTNLWASDEVVVESTVVRSNTM